MTIVIISIALTGILNVMNQTTRHSADPIIQQQAIAIAESYLEEIQLLPIIDPDGSNAGETRATFDNIDDYDGLSDTGAYDQMNVAMTGLNNYNVDVTISNVTISTINMKAITVAVTFAGTSNSVNLTGYRADY